MQAGSAAYRDGYWDRTSLFISKEGCTVLRSIWTESIPPFINALQRKGKGKGLDTCYSATYMSQTRDQQRFTIS